MIIRFKNICIVFVIITVVIMFYFVPWIMALEVETHSAINKYIAQSTFSIPNGTPTGFTLDDYLKKQLGMNDGKDTFFNSKKVFDIIGDGGVYEDKPYWSCPYLRSKNHYLNPLNDSGFSGLWGTSLFQGMPADAWALSPMQSQYCGYNSWNDVRLYYFLALTATTQADHDNYFAMTFQGVGQIMHLIEDMSVPAHVRNDIFHHQLTSCLEV